MTTPSTLPNLGVLTKPMTSPSVAVAAALSAMDTDPSRPRLTAYSATGDRTELSGTVLLNWGAKVAGLLVDELGAGPGDVVSVLTPSHWQTAGILLGSWWAGLSVTDADDASAIAAFVPEGGDSACDEVFVVSGHPLGAPSREVAAHQRDYSSAVLSQADRFSPRFSASAVTVESGPTADEAGAQLVAAAAVVSPADRVLTVQPWTVTDGGVFSRLFGLIAGGAAVIHCSDFDTADLVHRAQAEKATATMGIDLPGLPRLG